MIRLLKNLLYLAIMFGIIDFIFGFGLDLIRDNSPDGRYFKAKYSLEKSTEDVIIFGASRAEVNFVPYVFEDSLRMTCWNTGRGNQGLPFWICMEKGILKRHTPKIAIIDIEPDYLSSDLKSSYEPVGFLRPFYRSNKEIRPIINKISLFEKYFIWSSLYAYNSSYYYLLRPYILKGLDGKKSDKGWKPRTGQMSQIVSDPTVINTSKKLNIETVKTFNEFISSMSTKGCMVYIVISPRYNETVINTATIEYIRRMKTAYLVSFDDNGLFTGNSIFFRDPDHLNIEGSIKFTARLVNKIILAQKLASAQGSIQKPSF